MSLSRITGGLAALSVPTAQAADTVLSVSASGLLLIAGILTGVLFWERRSRQQREREWQQLQTTREHLQSALWGSGDGVWDWNLKTATITRMGVAEMLGYPAAELAPTSTAIYSLIHPDDRERVLRSIGGHLAGRRDNFELEYRLRHKDGSWCWVLDRGRLVARDENGAPLRFAGTTKNITARKQIEQELQLSATVLEHMAESVVITDTRFRIVRVNQAFCRHFGYSADEVLGADTALFNSSQHEHAVYHQLRDQLERDGRWLGELWQRLKDGSERLMSLDLQAVTDQLTGQDCYVGVMSDITERRRAENELRYLANYDFLTGLPNRKQFQERLQSALMQAGSPAFALLFLDVDHFKHVNDTLGHGHGDHLLQQVANRLRQCVADETLVARLGGDEFIVLLPGQLNQAEALAAHIVASFREPFMLAEQEIGVSPSIGISLYPQHGTDAGNLLKFADIAMYRAKHRGRGVWQIYERDMDEPAVRRLQLESALRRALERDELELWFQPRWDLNENRVTGFEALVRWQSSTLGAIPPDEFIAIAEDSGLIDAIGEWVLREACREAASWWRQGKPWRVSVNLSARQLQRADLPDRVSALLREYGLKPAALELELTESILLSAPLHHLPLQALRGLGVRLALDDFGTGYSAFAYLRRYGFDTLKIARDFVTDMDRDASAVAITATLIELGHKLGMTVVAEGVENSVQRERLRQLGCEEVQGYFVGVPVPASDLMRDLPEIIG
ncbi:EAL domain-containing protein [Permianibacter sp. IMCC34836]|uniref:putative bifunctional diguanylate cyclase/phosphodiesterase n=1 Tax=Permianibacter fluminis TaxID=2738515 RepID=UPI00155739DE|nr:GGDEF domain-containing phosphodiesterase [Permianibacter fluminis]NQD36677.1 EAL domain-containing protein [Permianibacter fluminis]